MNRFNTILLAAAAATVLVAAGPPAQAIDATLGQAYNSYKSSRDDGPGDWEKKVFSAEVTALIKAWHKHTGDNLTALSDYGWFCDCQDWDAKKFRWTRLSLRTLGPDRVETKVRLAVGWNAGSVQRLILVRQNGRWLIDDLFSESTSKGLKADLRQELKEKPGE